MAFARSRNGAQAKLRDRDQSHDDVASRPDRASTGPAHAAGARPVVACPCCGRPTIPIWRRPSDRLLGAFVPVSRHRCESHACRWEGNVRSGHGNRTGDAAGRNQADDDRVATTVSAWFIVYMVLVAVGIVFVFSAAHVDWNRVFSEDRSSLIDWAERTVFNQWPMQELDRATPETDMAFKP